MKISDDPELPFCVTEAIRKQAEVYSDSVSEHLSGVGQFDVQFSVTTLNKSPRQNHLFRRHSKEIVVSPWDRLHLLDGSIFHYILESHPQDGGISERRFGVMLNYNGKRVYFHGAADLFIPSEGHLIDFKRSSVVSLSFPKDDYEFQLNALAWIIKHQPKPHTYEVKRISNFFSLKDWDRNTALKGGDYPKKAMIWKDYVLWEEDKIKSEIFSRLKNHIHAGELNDDDLPLCTSIERWQRDKWRVFAKKKDGDWSKSSKGTYPTHAEAESAARALGEARIDKIEGPPVRCLRYCDVAIFCKQRLDELSNINKQEEELEIDI